MSLLGTIVPAASFQMVLNYLMPRPPGLCLKGQPGRAWTSRAQARNSDREGSPIDTPALR